MTPWMTMQLQAAAKTVFLLYYTLRRHGIDMPFLQAIGMWLSYGFLAIYPGYAVIYAASNR